MARIRVIIRKFHASFEVLHMGVHQLTCSQCCKLSEICLLHWFDNIRGSDNMFKPKFCPADSFKYVSDFIVLEVRNEKKKDND